MSTTIDERVVEMRFDNKDFERNAKDSINTIEKLKKSLEFGKSYDSLDGLEKSLNHFRLNDISDAVDSVADRFSNLGIIGMTALENITNRAVDAGITLAKSLSIDQISAGWQKYADKTSAVQTIISATGESMDVVSEQLKKLNWYTDETSYNFVDMVSNIGKFTSAGVSLDDAVSSMQGIANWAAVSGANAQAATRAMYNLSQAMGSGALKLMDWKSIENVNMSTVEFKQTAIDTAVELGRLTQSAEGFYEVVDGTADAFDAVNNFTASLKDGWFDTEVMTAVFNKYGMIANVLYELSEASDASATDILQFIEDTRNGVPDIEAMREAIDEEKMSVEDFADAITELSGEEYQFGLKAFKAGQEAKTFADAIDSVKDAVSTGWMNTFELIFGNYEKAKKTWTNLANDLWDIFASGGEARNAKLEEMSLSSWEKITKQVNEAGVSTEAFEQAVYDVAKAANLPIDHWIDKYGSLSATFETGWLNGSRLAEALRSLKGGLDGTVTSAEGTAASLEEINDLVYSIWRGDWGNGHERREALEAAGWNYDQIQNLVNKVVYGYKLTDDDVAGIFNSLNSASEMTEEELQYSIEELEKLAESAEDANSEISKLLNDSYKSSSMDYFLEGAGNAIKIIGVAVNDVRVGISKAFGPTNFKGINDFAKSFKDVTERVFDFMESSDTLSNIVAGLVFPLNVILTIFKGLLSVIKPIGKLVLALISPIAKLLSYVGKMSIQLRESTDNLKPLKDGIKAFVDILDAGADLLIRFAKYFYNAFKEPFLNKITKFFDKVKKKIKDLDIHPLERMTDLANKIRNYDFTSLADKIIDRLKNIRQLGSDLWKDIKDFFENFKQNHPKIAKFIDDIQQKIDKLKSAFNGLGKKNGGTSGEGSSGLPGLFEKIRSKGSEALEEIRSKFSGTNTVAEKFIEALEWISEKWAEFKKWGGEKWQNAKGFLAPILGDIDLDTLTQGGVLALIAVQVFGIIKAIKSLSEHKSLGERVKEILSNIFEPFTKTAEDVKRFDFFGFAAGVGILALSLVKLSKIPAEDLKNASKAMGAAILEMVGSFAVIMKFAGKKTSSNMVKFGVGVLAFSRALLNICKVIKKISGLIQNGDGSVVTALIILAGIIATMAIVAGRLKDSKFSGKTGLGFLGFATSLLIVIQSLNKIIKVIRKASIGELVGSVVILGALMAALVVVSKKMGNSSLKAGTGLGMIGMAVTLTLLVTVLKKLINICDKSSLLSILGALLIMGAIMNSIKNLAWSLNGIEVKVKTALSMAILSGVMIVMAGIMKMVGKMNFGQALFGFVALAGIMTALEMFLTGLNNVSVPIKTGISTVLILGGMMAFLLVFVELSVLLSKILDWKLVGAMVILAALTAGLALVIKAISKIQMGNVLAGVIGLAGIVVALIFFVKQAQKIEGMEQPIKSFIILMGSAITAAIIVVGFGKLIKANEIAGAIGGCIALGLFGVALIPLVNRLKEVCDIGNTDEMGKKLVGLGSMIAVFAGIAAAMIATGGVALVGAVGAAAALALLGWGLIPVVNRAKEISDLNPEACEDGLKAVKDVLSIYTDIALDLCANPDMFFAGVGAAIDLGLFGEALESVVSDAKAISELNPEGFVDKFAAVSMLIDKFNELATKMNEGGKQQYKASKRSADALDTFGNSLKSVVNRVIEISQMDVASATAGIEPVLTIVDKMVSLAGMFGTDSSLFSNANAAATSCKTFGNSLKPIVKDIAAISETDSAKALEGIRPINSIISILTTNATKFQNNPGLFENAKSVSAACSDFASSLKDITKSEKRISKTDAEQTLAGLKPLEKVIDMFLKIANAFNGSSSMAGSASSAVEALKSFGDSIDPFISSISELAYVGDADDISDVFTDIIDAFEKLNGIDSSSLESFAEGMKSLEGLSWKAIGDGLGTLAKGIGKLNSNPFEDHTDKVKNYTEALAEMAKIGDVIVDASSNILNSMLSLGANMISNLASGISSMAGSVRSSASNVSSSAYNGANSYTSSFYNIGANMGQGLANGISSKAGVVRAAAHALAVIAKQETENTLGIASPSKVAYKIGEFWDQGLINALYDGEDDIENAAEEVAQKVTSFTEMAISAIKEILDSGDMEPTITPVLDLSNVRANVSRLGSMLPASRSSVVLSSQVSKSNDVIQNAKNNAAYGSNIPVPVINPEPAAINPNWNVNVNFNGSLAQLASVLYPVITVEANRVGPSIVKG